MVAPIVWYKIYRIPYNIKKPGVNRANLIIFYVAFVGAWDGAGIFVVPVVLQTFLKLHRHILTEQII